MSERANCCTGRLTECTPNARQTKATSAKSERNDQRGDEPHRMSDDQNEWDIDETFAIHSAGEKADDQKW